MKVTPKQKSRRSDGDIEDTSDDVGDSSDNNYPRRRGSGSGRIRRGGDRDDAAAPTAPPTPAGRRGRTRSSTSDSSLKSMAKTVVDSSQLRAARSAITRSSPRHQRFQVAPRSKGEWLALLKFFFFSRGVLFGFLFFVRECVCL